MDANDNAVGGRGTSAPPHKTSQSQEKITFTNTYDEDLDVIFAAIEHNEDDVDLVQANDELVGVDGEDKETTSNKD